MKKTLYLTLPFLLSIFLAYFLNPWFFFGADSSVLLISSIFLVLVLVLNLKLESFHRFLDSKSQTLPVTILATLFIILMISFPVQDLRLGDGIILVENLILETELFGYNLVPDEIFEGLTHSLLYSVMKQYISNPLTPYRLLSSIAGLGLITSLIIFLIKKRNLHFLILMGFLSNSGILLFYGYTEHYTLVTLNLFLVLIYGIFYLDQDKRPDPIQVYTIAALSALSLLFHLISGFFIFGLIYFALYSSKNRKQFLTLGIQSSLLAGIMILPVYIYFTFFSDLRIDPGLTHATHLPFLKISQIFSMSHFRDLVYEFLFLSTPSIFVIFYAVVFYNQEFHEVLKKPSSRFLILSFLGIFFHFFAYNPMLGYPADWDLMGFIWIPLSVFGIIVLIDIPQIKFQLSVHFLYFILLINLLAYHLDLKPSQKEKIEFLSASIREYSILEKNKIINTKPELKKMISHTGFFLYRTGKVLEKKEGHSDLKEMHKILSDEFHKNEKIFNQKEELKIFLKKATEFHLQYLKEIENH